MADVTQILQQIESGDPTAAEQLLPLVYDELRQLATAKMAQESPDHTLQATALVHEAYMRLVAADRAPHWAGRRHFFGAAAEAMRRILIESARRKGGPRRGGRHRRLEMDVDQLAGEGPAVDLLELDEALDRLAAEAPNRAELVKLRYFAGMTMPEAAACLGISLATAERYWTFSKAWLYAELEDRRPAARPSAAPNSPSE